MKWDPVDIDLFVQTKEYVDTAVVPLLPLSIGENMKTIASKGVFTNIISQELERQMKGRIMLLPPFTYFEKIDDDSDNRIKKWENIIKQHFRHVVFLTCDERWQKAGNPFIWFPSIPLEHMDQDLKRKLIQEQIEQIMNILLQYWRQP